MGTGAAGNIWRDGLCILRGGLWIFGPFVRSRVGGGGMLRMSGLKRWWW